MSIPNLKVGENISSLSNISDTMKNFLERVVDIHNLIDPPKFYKEKLAKIKINPNNSDIYQEIAHVLQSEIIDCKQKLESISNKINTQHPFVETAHYFVGIVTKITERLHFLSKLMLSDDENSKILSACEYLINKYKYSFYIESQLSHLDIYTHLRGKNILDAALNRSYADLINAKSRKFKYNKTMDEIRSEIFKISKNIGIIPNLDENDGKTFFYVAEIEFGKSIQAINPFDPDFSQSKSHFLNSESLFSKQHANVEIILNLILNPDTSSICKLTENDDFGNDGKFGDPIIGAYRYLRFIKQRMLLHDIMSTVKRNYEILGYIMKKEHLEVHQLFQTYFRVIWENFHTSCANLMHENPDSDLGSYIISLFESQLAFEKGKSNLTNVINMIASNSKDSVYENFIEKIINYKIIFTKYSDITDIDYLRIGADLFNLASKRLQTLIDYHILNTRVISHLIGSTVDFPITNFNGNHIPTSIYEVFPDLDSLKILLKDYQSISEEIAEAFSISQNFYPYLYYGFWKSLQIDKKNFPFFPETYCKLKNCSDSVISLFQCPYIDSISKYDRFEPQIFYQFIKSCFGLRLEVIRTINLIDKYNEQLNEHNIVSFALNSEFNFSDTEKVSKMMTEDGIELFQDMLMAQKRYNLYLEAIIIHNNVNYNKKYIEDKLYGGDRDRKILYQLFFNTIHVENRKFQYLKKDLFQNFENSEEFERFITPLILQNELISITTIERSFLTFDPDPNRLIRDGRKLLVSDGKINTLVFPDQYEIMKIFDTNLLKSGIDFTAERLGIMYFMRYISNIQVENKQLSQSILKNRVNWDSKLLDQLTVDSCSWFKKILFLKLQCAVLNSIQNQYSKYGGSELYQDYVKEIYTTAKNCVNFYVHENYSPSWIDKNFNNCSLVARNELLVEFSTIKLLPITKEHYIELLNQYTNSILYLIFPQIQNGSKKPEELSILSVLDTTSFQFTRGSRILSSQSQTIQFNKGLKTQEEAVIYIIDSIINPKSVDKAKSNESDDFEFQIIKKPEFYRKSIRIEPLRSYYNTKSSEINRQFNQELAYADHFIRRKISELMTSLNPALVDEFTFSLGFLEELLNPINSLLTLTTDISPMCLIKTWTAYLSNIISDTNENEVKIIVFDAFRKVVLDTVQDTCSFDSALKLKPQLLELNKLNDQLNRMMKAESVDKWKVERLKRSELRNLVTDLRNSIREANKEYSETREKMVDIGIQNVEKFNDEEEQKKLQSIDLKQYLDARRQKIKQIAEENEDSINQIKILRILNVLVPIGIKKRFTALIQNRETQVRSMTGALLWLRKSSITDTSEINTNMRKDLNALTKAEFLVEELKEELDLAKHDSAKLENTNGIIQKEITEIESKIKSLGLVDDKGNSQILAQIISKQDELENMINDSELVDDIVEHQVREPHQKAEAIRRQIQLSNYNKIKHESENNLVIKKIQKENDLIKIENERIKQKIDAMIKDKENEVYRRSHEIAKKFTPQKVIVSPRRSVKPKYKKV
ncbi:hypothetical protein TVAG_360010 [Trichomonas vaginalis G3]|uniref:Uncharacterized protein n=1 Tax=Trichomonas vaginalis (strain ATCC PRA-98 / G3) TaxID=412133 RepID=A2DTC0_TRIV3|nr:hypothetical protein TVAGG3_0967960 [Trichomonas vaginalis G3]EAY16392.1 hypothetical protein TVAG_360010 [Trichomonas vaginalis G3]KAI5488380.1 hypothetical protein TVAGG3_0967960 [Trichomonas vaginalis G3]|eukprot:XP_001328615.1 hypothetical protein [Trichomonas vaginalis G3]